MGEECETEGDRNKGGVFLRCTHLPISPSAPEEKKKQLAYEVEHDMRLAAISESRPLHLDPATDLESCNHISPAEGPSRQHSRSAQCVEI